MITTPLRLIDHHPHPVVTSMPHLAPPLQNQRAGTEIVNKLHLFENLRMHTTTPISPMQQRSLHRAFFQDSAQSNGTGEESLSEGLAPFQIFVNSASAIQALHKSLRLNDKLNAEHKTVLNSRDKVYCALLKDWNNHYFRHRYFNLQRISNSAGGGMNNNSNNNNNVNNIVNSSIISNSLKNPQLPRKLFPPPPIFQHIIHDEFTVDPASHEQFSKLNSKSADIYSQKVPKGVSEKMKKINTTNASASKSQTQVGATMMPFGKYRVSPNALRSSGGSAGTSGEGSPNKREANERIQFCRGMDQPLGIESRKSRLLFSRPINGSYQYDHYAHMRINCLKPLTQNKLRHNLKSVNNIRSYCYSEPLQLNERQSASKV